MSRSVWRRAVTIIAVTASALAVLPAVSRAASADPTGPSHRYSWTARLIAPVTEVQSEPAAGRTVTRLSNRSGWIGAPVSLLVLESRRVPASHGRLWLRVALPVRPNGTRGWIPADNTQLTRLHWRLTISTERRTVSVFRYGRLWRRFSAVVGAPATPTPHGQFAIYEAIPQPNPSGFDGLWALHTTAFSNVLTGFDGGPGRIAIHGRGGASLRAPLGSALSHGCIRISNTNILLLSRLAAPGTPIRIT